MIRKRLLPLLILLCVLAAIGIPASQALNGWGIGQRQFAAQGDGVLRVAAYAFSIWGLLYAGLLAYALRRLILAHDGAVEAAMDIPLAAASLGCGLWIAAAGFNLMALTVVIILVSLISALTGLLRLRKLRPRLNWPDRATLVWPLSALTGWLTVAAMANVLTVLNAKGLIASPSTPIALAGIAAAGLAAGAILLVTRLASYAVPVAWGLIGVFVAEHADQPSVAQWALACALVLLAAAVGVGLRARRR